MATVSYRTPAIAQIAFIIMFKLLGLKHVGVCRLPGNEALPYCRLETASAAGGGLPQSRYSGSATVTGRRPGAFGGRARSYWDSETLSPTDSESLAGP